MALKKFRDTRNLSDDEFASELGIKKYQFKWTTLLWLIGEWYIILLIMAYVVDWIPFLQSFPFMMNEQDNLVSLSNPYTILLVIYFERRRQLSIYYGKIDKARYGAFNYMSAEDVIDREHFEKDKYWNDNPQLIALNDDEILEPIKNALDANEKVYCQFDFVGKYRTKVTSTPDQYISSEGVDGWGYTTKIEGGTSERQVVDKVGILAITDKRLFIADDKGIYLDILYQDIKSVRGHVDKSNIPGFIEIGYIELWGEEDDPQTSYRDVLIHQMMDKSTYINTPGWNHEVVRYLRQAMVENKQEVSLY